MPTGWSHRLLRSWAYDMTADANGVGTVTVRIRVGGMGLSTNAADYALLLDTDVDFSDAIAHTEGARYDAEMETITFSGVPLSSADGTFALAVAATSAP